MTTKALRTLIWTLAALPLAAQPVTYVIDSSQSSAQFSVRHLMVSNTKGEFSKVDGTLVFDSKNPAASKVEAVIDATTINTQIGRAHV